MADVVATILLLALTVTLFSALFAFVTRFPAPPAQPTNQFQASFVKTSTAISGLKIVHLTGPIVSPFATVYLRSSVATSNWQFTANGIPVSAGFNNTSVAWNLGQVWFTTFTSTFSLTSPVNVTIFIVSSGQLVFNAVLSNPPASFPPVITGTGTNPSPVTLGAAFQIFAVVGGNISSLVLNVTLTEVPGLSGLGTQLMVQSPANSGTWVYNVSKGLTTSNGTFYAFVNGINLKGQRVSGAAEVLIGPSGGGGGGGGGGGNGSGLSVAVGLTWEPNDTSTSYPPVPNQLAYFWAAVTYSGGLQGQKLNVTFYVNESVPGFALVKPVSCNFYGPAGVTISGPSTVTVYSLPQPTFPTVNQPNQLACTPPHYWLIGAQVTIQAVARVGTPTLLTAVGTTSFLDRNVVVGKVVESATNSNPPTAVNASFSKSCTKTTCPFILYNVTNYWTTVLDTSPAPTGITYAGLLTVILNGSNITAYNSTTIPPSGPAPTLLRGALPTGTGWIDPYGTARWQPAFIGTYTIQMWLTIRSTASGTPIIGYIYATATVLVTA